MRERRITLGLAPALPTILLVVIIVWALAAVLMLTGTLVNAREIDNTLPLIVNEVQPINQDLDDVKRAEETARITNRIRDAAAPLSGQASRIITEARSIDGSLGSILGTAGSINETAKSINGTVLSINDKVGAINSSVVSINAAVNSIEGSVLSINSSVDSIGSSVRTVFNAVGSTDAGGGTIQASVNSILATFQALEPETRSIDGSGTEGVAGINLRADRAVEEVAGIERDLSQVDVLVGAGDPGGHSTDGPGTIHGHANSIDCAPLLNLLGPTQYCGQ